MVLRRRISRVRRNWKERTLRERGAAAVEFALVAPLFFFVVFGGIEFGLMFRSYLSLQDVSRTAARVASVERSGEGADVEILEVIQNRVDVLNGELIRVIVFNPETLASDLGDSPAGCSDENAVTGIDGECTIYLAADVQSIVDGTKDIVASPEPGFPPSDRAALTNVGIYVEYRYQYVTGFFDSRTLSATSVEVIEIDVS